MHNKIGLCLIGFGLLLGISCASIPKTAPSPNFIGHVYEYKFNAMPMVDRPSSKGSPLMTTIYFYEPTQRTQIEDGMIPSQTVSKINTKLVDSISSDKTGAFNVHLQPGKYSVFIKYATGYYVPFYAGKDWVAVIEVKQMEVTELDFTVKANSSNE